jgi:hypothetical protein
MLLLLDDYAVVFLLEAVNNKHKFFADMWAIGAILAELFTLTPIFPGERYFYRPIFSLWLCAAVMMARQTHLYYQLVFYAFTNLINFIN